MGTENLLFSHDLINGKHSEFLSSGSASQSRDGEMVFYLCECVNISWHSERLSPALRQAGGLRIQVCCGLWRIALFQKGKGWHSSS